MTCKNTSPSNECEGYPDPLLFADVNEVRFYVTPSPTDDDSCFNDKCAFGSRCSALLKEFCKKLMCRGTTTTSTSSREDALVVAHSIACSFIVSQESTTTKGSLITNNNDWSTIWIDRKKPVLILCHGLMSWRNQWLLHKLAVNLSKTLDCHTLRFDFTGNGHSSGEWSYSNYEAEYHDLTTVVRYVQHDLQCHILGIVGHSKGVASVLRFAWEQDMSPPSTIAYSAQVPCFVNLAGRFTVPSASATPTTVSTSSFVALLSDDQRRQLEEEGKVVLTTRGKREFVVTKDALEERSRQDMRSVSLITSSSVLTIHGDKDETVCVDNAFRFDKAIQNHELCIIPDANHNFSESKHVEKIVEVTSDFIRRKSIKTSVNIPHSTRRH